MLSASAHSAFSSSAAARGEETCASLSFSSSPHLWSFSSSPLWSSEGEGGLPSRKRLRAVGAAVDDGRDWLHSSSYLRGDQSQYDFVRGDGKQSESDDAWRCWRLRPSTLDTLFAPVGQDDLQGYVADSEDDYGCTTHRTKETREGPIRRGCSILQCCPHPVGLIGRGHIWVRKNMMMVTVCAAPPTVAANGAAAVLLPR